MLLKGVEQLGRLPLLIHTKSPGKQVLLEQSALKNHVPECVEQRDELQLLMDARITGEQLRSE